MKPQRIQPQKCCLHDEPSHVKLQQILQSRYSKSHLSQIQMDILQSLCAEFQSHQIKINQQQWLHTILIHTQVKQHRHKVIYMGHGFGGTSLMYFPVVKTLLSFGNVVLWEIRGMGMSRKLDRYDVDVSQSQKFFVHPIELMMKFYQKYQEIYMIAHSFGAYLVLLYLNGYKSYIDRIKEVILFSPVGITPKEQDYKFQINSLSDCLHVVGNKISWLFGLTYKSPFRCLCACFKNKVFSDAVKNCGFDQKEEQLMKRLLLHMVADQDGSQSVFFNYFLPRVLPKYPIEPLYTRNEPEVKIRIFYGGQEDWVDKKGAQRLKAKYPSKIDVKIIKQSGHNFPFFPSQLRKIFTQILSLGTHHHHQTFNHNNSPEKKQSKNVIQDLMNHQQLENSDELRSSYIEIKEVSVER